MSQRICLFVLFLAGCGGGVSVAVSPSVAQVAIGQGATFTATVTGSSNTAVTWLVTEGLLGGAVDSSGHYTAPGSTGTFHVVATSAADTSKSATAVVTVVAGSGITVSISPSSAALPAGGTQTFSATVNGTTNTAVAWSVAEGANGGSVSGGLYTAPATPGTYHVVATSAADPTQSATATVTVVSSTTPVVLISPQAVTVPVGQTQQFTATVVNTTPGVSWAVAEGAPGGSIDANGLYTAPATPGTYHVAAASTASPSTSAIATVTVSTSGISISINPATVNVAASGSQPFVATVSGNANTAVTWSVLEGSAGGSISAGGIYSAPAAGGFYHVVATSQADTNRQASAAVNVVSLTLSPTSANLVSGTTQTFTAAVAGLTNPTLVWSVQEADGGTLATTSATTATYTAPFVQGTFHVVAASQALPSFKAVAPVTVTAPPVFVTLAPSFTVLAPSGTQTFTGQIVNGTGTLLWGTDGGTISDAGFYTAPTAPGDYTITATLAGGTANATAIARVVPDGGYTLSGTVAYAGSRTGRVYIVVNHSTAPSTPQPFGGLNGTSLAAPGPYAIRGVADNGAVVVGAYMDVLGTGDFNAAIDPSATVQVNLPLGGSVPTLTLTDPAPPAPAAPKLFTPVPGNTSVLVFYGGVYTAAGLNAADHYNLYWTSDNTTPGPGNAGASVYSLRAGLFFNTANGPESIAVVNSSLAAPLVNGTPYLFAMTAVANGQEGPISNVVAAQVGLPTTGVAVSGSVSWSGFSATGPAYLILFGQSTTQQTTTFIRVAAPLTSPQAFSFPAVVADTYQLAGYIDQDGNGEFDNADPYNFSSPTPIVVGGTAVTGQSLAFTSGNSVPSVYTTHSGTPADPFYSLGEFVAPNGKQPVMATVTSGPNVKGPIDLAIDGFSSSFNGGQSLGPVLPAVGNSALYNFQVTYTDGSSETLTSSPSAVLAESALNTPVGTASSGVPTFSWSAPSPAPALQYFYQLVVFDVVGNILWAPQFNSSTTAVLYNADNTASLTTLTSGASYGWTLTTTDVKNNSSTASAFFTVP